MIVDLGSAPATGSRFHPVTTTSMDGDELVNVVSGGQQFMVLHQGSTKLAKVCELLWKALGE